MAGDPFARMQDRLHARLGSEAVLRGEPCLATLEHGVAILGEHGEVVAFRTVASIRGGPTPRQGDTLVVKLEGGGTKSYTIDALQGNDGYSSSCILL